MVSKIQRRKVDPVTAARWAKATRDQETLRERYAPLADEVCAMAEERVEDLSQSLAESDRGAPQG